MYNIKYIHPCYKCINEGIDIDYDTKTISFNSNHENNVDTSVINNPQYNKINGFNVWSVFKSKTNINKRGDGNPLIYSYKNEKDWKFKFNKDRLNLEWQISQIIDKFLLHYYHGSVVVLAPSTSILNSLIVDVLKSKIKNLICISGLIMKLSTDEVFDLVLNKNSQFRKTYPGHDNFIKHFDELQIYLNRMDDEKPDILLDI